MPKNGEENGHDSEICNLRTRGSHLATLGFFSVMTLLAGYAKDFMTIKLFGSMNVGFSLILLAYVICWAGALLYVRAASGPFDAKTKLVIEHNERRN